MKSVWDYETHHFIGLKNFIRIRQISIHKIFKIHFERYVCFLYTPMHKVIIKYSGDTVTLLKCYKINRYLFVDVLTFTGVTSVYYKTHS